MPRAPAPKGPQGAAPAAAPPGAEEPPGAAAHAPDATCPHYHRAVELLGRRWTGAIVEVLLRAPADRPLRFGEIAQAIPEISDRMLTRRLKELQDDGCVERRDGGYALTAQGRDLHDAVTALKAWGRRWLDTSASSFRPA
jgi:DNA-binding HxlR family transcriptional regulator